MVVNNLSSATQYSWDLMDLVETWSIYCTVYRLKMCGDGVGTRNTSMRAVAVGDNKGNTDRQTSGGTVST